MYFFSRTMAKSGATNGDYLPVELYDLESQGVSAIRMCKCLGCVYISPVLFYYLGKLWRSEVRVLVEKWLQSYMVFTRCKILKKKLLFLGFATVLYFLNMVAGKQYIHSVDDLFSAFTCSRLQTASLNVAMHKICQ